MSRPHYAPLTWRTLYLRRQRALRRGRFLRAHDDNLRAWSDPDWPEWVFVGPVDASASTRQHASKSTHAGPQGHPTPIRH